jgi:hypothetical protein
MVLLILIASWAIAFAQTPPEVKTDKDIYSAGEPISVLYFGAPGDSDDWICIIPAGTPDDEAGTYKYLYYKMKQGVIVFDPPAPGKYEVRVYYNYGKKGYAVSARHAFSVEATQKNN